MKIELKYLEDSAGKRLLHLQIADQTTVITSGAIIFFLYGIVITIIKIAGLWIRKFS
jgi:hypothetical protein